MSTITIKSGGLVTKDPSDVKVFTVDWDTSNLGVGVTITTSTWTITAIKPSTSDTALTKDNESILAGNRKTQVRLTAGTVHQTYEIANKIVTNETPAQTKEKSFRVLIQNQ
jgi:hypothetical protein